MYVHSKDMPTRAFYHLMTQAVMPRPIAWVLTDNGSGEGSARYNLAPFSFFNAVSSAPPLLMIGLTHKGDGHKKDTWHNLVEGKKCTIHLSTEADIDAVVASSIEVAHGVSEVELGKHELADGPEGALPRLKNSPIAFHCTLHHVYEISDHAAALFCKIESLYVADNVVHTDADGRFVIDPKQIKPLARLGGNYYSLLGSLLERKRPPVTRD